MRKGAAATGTLSPFGMMKMFGSLGALPRNPRTMLVYDASLAWAAILLLAIGVVMVYSASIAMAEVSAHTGFRAWYFLVRHVLFVAIGVIAAFVAFQVPMKVWQHLASWLFVGGAVLLVLVLIPGIGKSVNGSRRWLSLAFFNVQPSEFMKLAVVLYAASYAVRKAAFLHAEQPLKQTLLRGFLPLFAVMVATGGLLLLEPDFGAFVVIVAIAFGILYLGGLDWRLFLGLLLLLPFGLSAILVAAPYRLQRLVAFLDPWSDPFGKGYQLSHSLIAFGRGEWFGVGLGSSSVEKLLYLPEAHTDFPACGHRRGAGLRRRAGRDRALHLAAVSRVCDRAAGRAIGQAFRFPRRARHRRVDRRAGVHQHRRQHGRAADQGTHAAAAVVRRVRHRRELRRARDPAAR